jgi:hypothetical protein
MPHRRKGRRLSLVPLDPTLRLTLLKLTRAPRHLITRAGRTHTPAAIEALLDPRRTTPPSTPRTVRLHSRQPRP